MPKRKLQNKSPFEILFGRSSNYTRLKIFECLCYPWLRPYASSKVEPRSTPCIFLGYCPTKSAYKCLDPSTNKLYLSRHVRFIENQFPMSTSSCSSYASVLPRQDFLAPASLHTKSTVQSNILPHSILHGPVLSPVPSSRNITTTDPESSPASTMTPPEESHGSSISHPTESPAQPHEEPT